SPPLPKVIRSSLPAGRKAGTLTRIVPLPAGQNSRIAVSPPVGKTSAVPSPLACRSQLRAAQSATTGSPEAAADGETVDAGSVAGRSAAASPHAASSRVAASRPPVQVSRIALTPLAASSQRGTSAPHVGASAALLRLVRGE